MELDRVLELLLVNSIGISIIFLTLGILIGKALERGLKEKKND